MKKVTSNSILKATLLSVAVVLFCSCENVLEDLTTFEVPLKSLELNFNADVLDNSGGYAPELRNNAVNPETNKDGESETRIFSGKDTLRINAEEFGPYLEYANLVKTIKISKIEVKITSEDGGSLGKNIILRSNYLGDEWTLAEYQLNTLFEADEKLLSMLSKTLDAILKEKDVDFEFYGETDASVGGKINFNFVIGGALIVQLLGKN
ncbi:MAG: hypothetical protein LBS54_07455 [Dysgonamonadaceae bacterium]|jgi:hypothetical protein|nr:hypothetical protein [Dysgonamonadaceae bacterium]